MSMFPHTVTVYNVQTDESPETMFKSRTINYITVLRGVLLSTSHRSANSKNGLVGADEATLYVPFSVKATDGLTGAIKLYADPLKFSQAEDRSGLWTFSSDGNSYVVDGEVVEPNMSVQELESKYDVYNVVCADKMNFGGRMAHWEVRCV